MVRARAEAVAAGVILLALAAVPATARASGFLLYEQSATALGKGSAMVASARDPSAAWFNPAALGFVTFAGAALNMAVLMPRTGFSPRLPGPNVESGSEPRLVPSLFAHVPLGDRVQMSLALLAPSTAALAQSAKPDRGCRESQTQSEPAVGFAQNRDGGGADLGPDTVALHHN